MALGVAVSLGAAIGLAPLQGPLRTDADPGAIPAETCGGCHASQFADWSGSRHRQSHTNTLYQVGLSAEPRQFCVTCHSPLAEQYAEVVPNLPWYGERGPHGSGRDTHERGPEPLAEEGVSCAVCHLRGGTVLTPNATTALHPTREEPALTSGDACGACHEFPVPEVRDGALVLTDVPMQSTWSEWKAWGGESTCVDCHMPGGRHLFRGAHDAEWLRASVATRRDGPDLVVASVGVGHALPSGDLFRHLSVEVRRGEAWEPIGRIGRRFALVEDADGRAHKQLVEDTSLRPGVEQRFSVRDRPWRLVYHYASEQDEARGYLADADLYLTLAEGR